VSIGTYNLMEREPRPKTFAFDQLTVPACGVCNDNFSLLEDRAKAVVERLLARKPLSSMDLNVLLDWLDKVRTGIWLNLMWLEGNPWGIEPKFHIHKRLGLHDRSVGIAFIEGRQDGFNLVGPESPCFGLSPTTMCMFVNDIGLFSSSTAFLCSRRLGFPFATKFVMRDDGLLEGWMVPGLERILRPLEPIGPLQSEPFIYQPVFERMEQSSARMYDTEYVKANALDFDAGRGALFLQHRGEVFKYDNEPSIRWMPQVPLSLRQVYRAGRRWAYEKLERHYAEQAMARDPMPRAFTRVHKHLLSIFEKQMAS
jgi:hypothetical protein